ncbi:hypothetical protein EK904_002737 [Melospiza melodia maxima]|nr:hypothetical protein EK904_002737 [Melospiza melodia maxima]
MPCRCPCSRVCASARDTGPTYQLERSDESKRAAEDMAPGGEGEGKGGREVFYLPIGKGSEMEMKIDSTEEMTVKEVLKKIDSAEEMTVKEVLKKIDSAEVQQMSLLPRQSY